MKIQIIKFRENVKLPKRAHYNDAGADVYAIENYDILPHQTIKVPLGFGMKLPDGFMCNVYPRSGLTSKGIISHIPPIDSGYTGEIHCIITNTTDEVYMINKDDKIAQLVVVPIILSEFTETLGEERGDNGFGSTDNK
ncbi:MAG: dUTP diphosphatase [Bacilli bacterium]|nr:dUTP diphosphatase [Bacilli bacterium]